MAAMAESIDDRGLIGTRVEDVILLAGASRRTFYECFENRDACFLATYDAIAQDLVAIAAERGHTGEAAIEAVLEHLAEWPSHGRVVLLEVFALGSQGLERLERTIRDLAAALRSRPRAPQPTTLRLSEQQRADVALGAIHRLVLRALIQDKAHALPELASTLAALAAACEAGVAER